MKASVSPTAVIFAVLIGFSAASVRGQDAVVQKDGQRREGQILAVKAGAIRIKVGPVETGIPMANVASVTMAPPKDFVEALALWGKGDASKALPKIKPLVEQYHSLPTPWAQRAAALLGEALLATGDVAGAEAALTDFQKSYPGAGSSVDVALAGLAVEKKDFSTAREKLVPIVEIARKTMIAKPGESAVFGQALYLMGRTQEAGSEDSEALENYLLVVNLFREDQSSVAKAAERASALKEKKVIVP